MSGPPLLHMALLRRLLSITLVSLLFATTLWAQAITDNHQVQISVAPITIVQATSGSISLIINAANAVAGVDQMIATDQSSSLLWGTNSSARKITVQTSLGTPRYTLKVVALNPTAGSAAPEVTLSTVAGDFLLNIGRSLGSCALQYTGIALASQGVGMDVHTITFTVQAQ